MNIIIDIKRWSWSIIVIVCYYCCCLNFSLKWQSIYIYIYWWSWSIVRENKENLVLPYAHPQSPVAVICYVISLCLAYVVVPASTARRRRHYSPVHQVVQVAQQFAVTAPEMPLSSVDVSSPPPGGMLPPHRQCPQICNEPQRKHIFSKFDTRSKNNEMKIYTTSSHSYTWYYIVLSLNLLALRKCLAWYRMSSFYLKIRGGRKANPINIYFILKFSPFRCFHFLLQFAFLMLLN